MMKARFKARDVIGVNVGWFWVLESMLVTAITDVEWIKYERQLEIDPRGWREI